MFCHEPEILEPLLVRRSFIVLTSKVSGEFSILCGNQLRFQWFFSLYNWFMKFVVVFYKKSKQHNEQHLEKDYRGTKLPWILLKSEKLLEISVEIIQSAASNGRKLPIITWKNTHLGEGHELPWNYLWMVEYQSLAWVWNLLSHHFCCQPLPSFLNPTFYRYSNRVRIEFDK